MVKVIIALINNYEGPSKHFTYFELFIHILKSRELDLRELELIVHGCPELRLELKEFDSGSFTDAASCSSSFRSSLT